MRSEQGIQGCLSLRLWTNWTKLPISVSSHNEQPGYQTEALKVLSLSRHESLLTNFDFISKCDRTLTASSGF